MTNPNQLSATRKYNNIMMISITNFNANINKHCEKQRVTGYYVIKDKDIDCLKRWAYTKWWDHFVKRNLS